MDHKEDNPTLQDLRELPLEVDLDQVQRMVATFPLAAGALAKLMHLLKFNLNTVLMLTTSAILLVSGLLLFTGNHSPQAPSPEPVEVVAPAAIATDDALPEEATKAHGEAPTVAQPEKTTSDALGSPAATAAANDPTEQAPGAPETTHAAAPSPLPAAPAMQEPAPGTVAPQAGTTTGNERRFDLANFNSVVLKSAVDVVIEQGDFLVTATGDPRILERLKISVKRNQLVIDSKTYVVYHPEKTVVHVQMPKLQQVAALGSGDLQVSAFSKCDGLKVTSGGSGDIKLAGMGQLTSLEIAQTGSGDIVLADAGRMAGLKITSSGSGDLTIHQATVAATVEINSLGSGDIRVSGVTENLEALLSGSGDLQLKELQVAKTGNVRSLGSGDVFLGSAQAIGIMSSGSGKVHVPKEGGNRN